MNIDKPTLDRISKLHPSVRGEVTELINDINTDILTGAAKVRISEGYRSFDEQNAIYAKGRTKPGPIATKAKGGQSIHNYGMAFDIVLVINGKDISWDTKKDWDNDKKSDWMEVVEYLKKHGWSWGGDWTSFKDMPHFDKKGYTNWRELIKYPKDKNGYIILK
ncbi:MAG: M15 family metallopeptidase [Lachnospiraceae bacterium]|jgi:peptidoglycan L-alanyl-D-glutamate endopeptidase CwlK|nr:M15 family metallopeptidase [Lachnospiraceae bacterium]